jgi:hypothetical protein
MSNAFLRRVVVRKIEMYVERTRRGSPRKEEGTIHVTPRRWLLVEVVPTDGFSYPTETRRILSESGMAQVTHGRRRGLDLVLYAIPSLCFGCISCGLLLGLAFQALPLVFSFLFVAMSHVVGACPLVVVFAHSFIQLFLSLFFS